MFWAAKMQFWQNRAEQIVRGLSRSHGPEGRTARDWPTGAMVVAMAVLLAATMVLDFTN